MTTPPARRLPVGAELSRDGAHFRVWAPLRSRVEVVLDSGTHPLAAEADGYFAGVVPGVAAGARYRYRLDGGDAFPDPASRFQPDGPHGPSQLVDPTAFAWTDHEWKGKPLAGQVIYELHIGTFTREGTWAAAARELPELAALGVTVLEVMPVADFPGRFGWGYDGVNLFAPTRLYGTPDDFRRFVDAAHAHGLAVILDVVYNHFGPDGNYLGAFSAAYETDRHTNEWGAGLNFDGPDSGPVREFFVANAGYWVDEFHLDGLRLDATQAIVDDSPRHILADIAVRVRAAANGRATILINENEPQDARLARPVERGGYGLDGLWNDDFHHSLVTALTGRREAYFTDHPGNPQEFVSAAKYGFLFQGQRYAWQEARRGSPAFDLPPWAFVAFLQNHDQVANCGRGERVHTLTSPGRLRAGTALLLLGPATPLLFMGQEFAAAAPFLYFADTNPEIAPLVRNGRAEFLTQFRSLDHPGLAEWIPDPDAETTFARCRLDFADRARNAKLYRLHKDLLALRRTDPAFGHTETRRVDGAVLGPAAFVLRFFDPAGDRLVLVNFGSDLHLAEAPEPLLAPPAGQVWEVLWSSEEPEYGGHGTPPPEVADGWRVMGEAAVVLRPMPQPVADPAAMRKAAEVRAKANRRRERTPLGP